MSLMMSTKENVIDDINNKTNTNNNVNVNDDDENNFQKTSSLRSNSGGHRHRKANNNSENQKLLQRKLLQTDLDSSDSSDNRSIESDSNQQQQIFLNSKIDSIPMMMADNDSKPASPGQDGLALVDRKFYDRIYYFTQILNLFIFILILTWLIKYVGGFGFEKSEQVFNFHPTLMFFGFIFIYSNSMLIYRSMRGEAKQRLKLFHTILNGSVMFVALFGSIAAYYFHQDKNITHFYSLHSWLGITTWLMFLSQFCAGFVAFLFPGASFNIRSKLMPFHRFLGVAIFIIACVTCITGLNEKAIFALKNPKYSAIAFNGVLVNLIGLLICVLAGLVTFLTTKSEYQRRPLPEEQVINLSFDLTSSHLS